MKSTTYRLKYEACKQFNEAASDTDVLTYFTKKHILNAFLSFDNLLSILLHLSIIVSIGIDLLLDLGMFAEETLRLCKIRWDVLGCDRSLCLRQPLLEVVKVLEELLKFTRLSEAFITNLQLNTSIHAVKFILLSNKNRQEIFRN